MSASWPGSMRGPWAKTPVLLLLLLLLLSTLTRTVLCQTEEEEENPDVVATEEEQEEEAVEAVEAIPDETEASEAPPPDINGALPSEQPVTDEGTSGEIIPDGELGSGEHTTASTNTDEVTDPTTEPEQEALSSIIILIPVVLVVLIIAMIVCGIVINRRWNKKAGDQALRKEDPYLDGSSSEKVPMPMFEEDVPSVLELEMDELDQWMKKDGETAEDSKQHT